MVVNVLGMVRALFIARKNMVFGVKSQFIRTLVKHRYYKNVWSSYKIATHYKPSLNFVISLHKIQ